MNHQKLVLLYGQGMSVFGSSNFTSPSDNSQQENNYFTTKTWMFQWFQSSSSSAQWNNSTGNIENDAVRAAAARQARVSAHRERRGRRADDGPDS